MKYGQVVIGAPGSGKSTYCAAMDQFLTALNRPHTLINLDPAAEGLKYTPAINLKDLIKIEDVQNELELGPNGALLYCLDFLHKNIEWLLNQINMSETEYFVIDTPGQVETYSIDCRLKEILELLKAKCKLELTCVHLTDSHNCTDSALFISGMLVSLSATINMEMPFVNILSKIDLLEQYGDLPFPLEFYTDELDPIQLTEAVTEDSSAFGKKYATLTKKLCELVEGYSLVSYTPLNITDKMSMSNALQIIDKASGYAYKQFELSEDVVDIEKQEMANREYIDKVKEKVEDDD